MECQNYIICFSLLNIESEIWQGFLLKHENGYLKNPLLLFYPNVLKKRSRKTKNVNKFSFILPEIFWCYCICFPFGFCYFLYFILKWMGCRNVNTTKVNQGVLLLNWIEISIISSASNSLKVICKRNMKHHKTLFKKFNIFAN